MAAKKFLSSDWDNLRDCYFCEKKSEEKDWDMYHFQIRIHVDCPNFDPQGEYINMLCCRDCKKKFVCCKIHPHELRFDWDIDPL